MEKFRIHIVKLLAQHDYVVIPDLGGFVIQTKSAELLEDRIVPPGIVVAFNPLMNHSDGLLAIEVARSEKVSYRQAVEMVKKDVERISYELHQAGEFSMGDLGMLLLKNGSVIFSPAAKVSSLPHHFGLSELYVSERQTETVKRISMPLPSKRIYRYAAVALLAIGLFCATPSLNDARVANKANLLSFPAEKLMMSAVSQEVKPDSIQELAPSEEHMSSESDVQEYYHVVVAVMARHEAAEELAQSLRDDNYTGVHVVDGGKTSKVVMQTFTDMDKAVHYMETLRKTDKQFETAWVMHQ